MDYKLWPFLKHSRRFSLSWCHEEHRAKKGGEVLDHHIFAIIPLIEVLLGIRSTVPPSVDALGSALLAEYEGLWAVPGDVVRSELSESSLLKQLGMAPEVLDKIHLLVAARAAFIIAVHPEFVLDPLVRVRHGFSPVQLHNNMVSHPLCQGLLEGLTEFVVDEGRGDGDLVDGCPWLAEAHQYCQQLELQQHQLAVHSMPSEQSSNLEQEKALYGEGRNERTERRMLLSCSPPRSTSRITGRLDRDLKGVPLKALHAVVLFLSGNLTTPTMVPP
ncbi:hypothetical protein MUK42_10951 [Musa troglodytarum]|uniref:Uncharacterized protein n=1 Tax=Musa troglodytarum TaxID=320322 RepID=A0A9E7GL06_9LILI|nr:hypothetical protein MUK42_10951 [Musa troglodytarum]